MLLLEELQLEMELLMVLVLVLEQVEEMEVVQLPKLRKSLAWALLLLLVCCHMPSCMGKWFYSSHWNTGRVLILREN